MKEILQQQIEFEKLRRKVEEREENMPSRVIFGLKNTEKRIPMTKMEKQTLIKQQLQEQI